MLISTILRSQSIKSSGTQLIMFNLYRCTSRHHALVRLPSLCKRSILVSCQRMVSSHTLPGNQYREYQTVQTTNIWQPRRFFSRNLHRTSPLHHAALPNLFQTLHPWHLPCVKATTNGHLQTWRAFSTTRSMNKPRGTMLVDIMRDEKDRKETLVETKEEEEQHDEEEDVAMEMDEVDMISDDISPTRPHIPVMMAEVLKFLDPEENQVFLDMTFGSGGHAAAILQQCSSCTVLALDRDPVAIEMAKNMAEKYGKDRLIPLQGRFSHLRTLLKKSNILTGSVDGVLIDAGCSSMQFDTADRGFALSRDGPLDMRMDGNRLPNQPTAADYINSLDAPTLTNILYKYGEESRAKKIAKTIVDYREKYRPIQTTQELATVVSFAFSHTDARRSKDSLGRHAHVATKTFLALRILVNNELHELNEGLKQMETFVKPGGKLAVLSFHSMEDRIVKRFLQGRDVTEKAKSLHRKKSEASEGRGDDGEVVMEMVWDMQKDLHKADDEEIEMNPRARSAKLRTAVKC